MQAIKGKTIKLQKNPAPMSALKSLSLRVARLPPSLPPCPVFAA